MKTSCLLLLLLVVTAHGSSDRTVWTKTLHPEYRLHYKVGTDGTVAFVDGSNKIYWIARSGEVLREFQPTHAHSYPIYVTRDELIVAGGEAGMTLHQFVGFDQVEETFINHSPTTMFVTGAPFSYPYLVVKEDLEDGSVNFSLLDLTSPNSLTVVGDAVIGVHGNNLRVRWKSVVSAKYKVQFSADLETWTDYSGVMDGTTRG